MIERLKSTYSYTADEYRDKVNQVIDKVNELDSQAPAIEVVLWSDVKHIYEDVPGPVHPKRFLARPIK